MFRDTQGKKSMVNDIEKIFNRYLSNTKEIREKDIRSGLEIEEDMSLMMSLSRYSTKEFINMGLYGALVGDKNR